MPNASDGKKFPYTKKGMADYKKYQGSLDRYNKTMGFKHKDVASFKEQISRGAKYGQAIAQDSIQKSKYGNVTVGKKKMFVGFGSPEPHVHRPDIAEGYYKRPNPSYIKDRFEGKVAGYEKAFLSTFGNRSKMATDDQAFRWIDPERTKKARKKLVKGT